MDAETEFLNELHRLSVQLRGKYLDAVAWIDVLLSNSLSIYFCSDPTRRKLFFSDIMSSGEFRFSAKLKLLRTILKHFDPEAKAKFPDLARALTEIMELRNKLAHAHLDSSPATIAARQEDCVGFVYYEAGETKRLQLSFSEMEVRLAATTRAITDLRTLNEMLNPPSGEQAQASD